MHKEDEEQDEDEDGEQQEEEEQEEEEDDERREADDAGDAPASVQPEPWRVGVGRAVMAIGIGKGQRAREGGREGGRAPVVKSSSPAYTYAARRPRQAIIRCSS